MYSVSIGDCKSFKVGPLCTRRDHCLPQALAGSEQTELGALATFMMSSILLVSLSRTSRRVPKAVFMILSTSVIGLF